MAPAELNASDLPLTKPIALAIASPLATLSASFDTFARELDKLESESLAAMLAVEHSPVNNPSLSGSSRFQALQSKPVHAGATPILTSEFKPVDAMQSSDSPASNSYSAPVMPAVPEDSRASMHLTPRPRPTSVASFVSTGTIEVEGFGFDYDSDENDDTFSVFDNSVYEGSVYGDGTERRDRPVTPTTLMRRADRILAGAKKKLDLCGENLTKARESMVVSPGPGPRQAAVEARWQSFGGSMSTSNMNALRRDSSSHFRTASESAVGGVHNGQIPERAQSALGPRILVNGDGPKQELTRSKSTQQMRALRDQMKDLRGKISNLQQQTRSDSLKRRSINSLRSAASENTITEDDYSMDSAVWVETEHSASNMLEEVEEVDEQEYETVQEELDDDEDDGRGTPKPYNPLRESRHEDREDAFSYDSLFLGNGLYATHRDLAARRPMSMESVSSSGTITGIAPAKRPTINGTASHSRNNSTHSRNHSQINSRNGRRSTSPQKGRRDSFSSETSFRTAMEMSVTSSNASSPTDELQEGHHALRPTPRAWMSPPEFSLRDDGYHSAPNTPKAVEGAESAVRTPPITHPLDSIRLPAEPPRNPRLLALANGIQSKGSGLTHNLVVTTSHRPQNGALISKEVGLRLGDNDAEMVDKLVEVLGKLCVRLEVSGESQKMEYRSRMEMALNILEGRAPDSRESDDDETF